MLLTIFITLFALWLIGLFSSYTIGGFIHVLLVMSIIVLLVRLLTGREPT
ncbi:MAG: lmo0937 family membrane protein [Ignavibacteriae bacterium]|nr:MAG: lmo0937 family membrane protein [Ignavibacteriota bacterium]